MLSKEDCVGRHHSALRKDWSTDTPGRPPPPQRLVSQVERTRELIKPNFSSHRQTTPAHLRKQTNCFLGSLLQSNTCSVAPRDLSPAP